MSGQDDTHKRERLFKAMFAPGFYPHPVQSVRYRETHISKVYLTGERVYKIKKPVDFGFLDFRDLEQRKQYCRKEVILNRRLAPNVYLGVVSITFDGSNYHIEGPGKVVEYAVKMRQLPENRTLLRMIKSHEINSGNINLLAETLCRFYRNAETGPEIQKIASWSTIRCNWEENFTQLTPFTEDLIDKRKFQIISAVVRSFLHRRKSLFQRRIDDDKIRDCHGDIRAGHIYFVDGVKIIDCIEFNDRFRYSDTAMDLAFLIMDLDFEGHPQLAHRILDAYVRCSGDGDMFVLIDFYKCYRAVVRCKVNCFQASEKTVGTGKKMQLVRDAQRFLNLAYEYAIQFSRPTLWIVCGMPASGKSTLSKRLSETLQAALYRSDSIRKALFHVPEYQTRDVAFETDIYSSQATSLTYGKLMLMAQEDLKKGRSVILDATFSQEHQRDKAIRLSGDMDVNVVFIECRTPFKILKKRMKNRMSASSISDARMHHLPDFIKRFESLDDIRDEMHILVDTSNSLDDSLRHVLSQDYAHHSPKAG
jgi:aminoglycoside phosphotransferase family enzyme/predicted kinase